MWPKPLTELGRAWRWSPQGLRVAPGTISGEPPELRTNSAAPHLPPPGPCVGVRCPRLECQRAAGVCNPATGTCGAGTPKADGTTCSKGTCQGGVCKGRHVMAAFQGVRIGNTAAFTKRSIAANSPNTLLVAVKSSKPPAPTPSPDKCVGVTCPARKECEERGSTCNRATGLCDVPPPKADGTACSTGSCVGGACTGGACLSARLHGCISRGKLTAHQNVVQALGWAASPHAAQRTRYLAVGQENPVRCLDIGT